MPKYCFICLVLADGLSMYLSVMSITTDTRLMFSRDWTARPTAVATTVVAAGPAAAVIAAASAMALFRNPSGRLTICQQSRQFLDLSRRLGIALMLRQAPAMSSMQPTAVSITMTVRVSRLLRQAG